MEAYDDVQTSRAARRKDAIKSSAEPARQQNDFELLVLFYRAARTARRGSGSQDTMCTSVPALTERTTFRPPRTRSSTANSPDGRFGM